MVQLVWPWIPTLRFEPTPSPRPGMPRTSPVVLARPGVGAKQRFEAAEQYV